MKKYRVYVTVLFVMFSFMATLHVLSAQTSLSRENFFWDNVKSLSGENSYFPVSVYDGTSSFVFFESVNKKANEIKISWIKKNGGGNWSRLQNFPESFKYSGDDVPDMYSAAAAKGVVAVSVLDLNSPNGIVRVYSSKNGGESFSSFTFPELSKQVASTRIYATSSGGFMLFVSLGEGKKNPTDSSFSLLFSESSDGVNWSKLESFKPSESILNAFSPFLVRLGGRDIVYFEGWVEKDSSSSQIYYVLRERNGGWSAANVFSDDTSLASGDDKAFLDYKNFRPVVYSDGRDARISWERTLKSSGTASVMVAPLSQNGKVSDRKDVEALNGYGNARRPCVFGFKKKTFVLWFDDRNGVNNVHLAENLGVQWIEHDSVLRKQNNSTNFAFACPVVSKNKKGEDTLSIVWQQSKNDSNLICTLEEDSFVDKPQIQPRNFTAGRHSREKEAAVKIIPPNDVSEILGISVIATTNENDEPPEDELSSSFKRPSEASLSAKISEFVEGDQKIYFKAKALDKAGNWSETSTLSFYYDVTPPKAPRDIFFDKDSYGFASSNDISFNWKNGDEEDGIADLSDRNISYSWSLTKLSKIDKKYEVTRTKKLSLDPEKCKDELELFKKGKENLLEKIKEPALKPSSSLASANFRNRDNGYYAFSVRAFDSVGNASEPATVVLFLNKYKAATVIKNVHAEFDDYGNVTLGISGEEFVDDGYIEQVIITNDRNGKQYVYFNEKGASGNGDYEISPSEIKGISIANAESGSYSVQIRHSERGLSTWNRKLVLGESGTVKYEKQYNFEPVWRILENENLRYQINTNSVVFWFVMTLIVLGILGCARGLAGTVRETMQIKNEVQLILRGDAMSFENRNKIDAAVRVRFSLKFKFGLFTTALLLLIVAGVALAIGTQMSSTQERILITGLKDRIKVAMGNMASGVQTYLPDGREKLTELGSVVNQTDNFAEAKYATILSYFIDEGSEKKGSMDYVWATNDSEISSKIYENAFDAGTVRYKVLPDEFFTECNRLNESAIRIVSEYSNDSILAFQKLNEFSAKNLVSYPAMSDEALDRNQTEYYFMWPICYEQGRDRSRVLQAAIFMEVNTETLINQVDASRKVVFFIAAIAAAVASVIGLVCAFMLASIIVNPIKRVAQHVKTITDTVDKEELDGFVLNIKSHDEIRTLGDSVNDMTKGLVKGARDEKRAKIEAERAAKAREDAAIASEQAAKAQAQEAKARAEAAEMNIMNLDGQAVQKAFIPLITSGSEKETSSSLNEKEIQMYGYYEGTDAVSGDYFDYKKLDDRWYAIIKCDASGHGVPAALIMTIVATIFRRYFSNWNFKSNGTKLNLLVSDINDFIESLGLRGKFAAMLICLFDTKTGDLFMCNAGDNVVHYFDSADKKLKILTLNESPAAGPLPSFMVEMKGGYKVEKFHLKKNDVLFLYTDGIEESTRFFRDRNFEVTECRESGLAEGEVHATHKVGQTSEQMEPQRVQEVIEAVLNKRKYILKKYHNPEENEVLEFDFTKCEGSLEEVITALTAVEKVFRIYKKHGASGTVLKTELEVDGKSKTLIQINGDGIKVDRKIDTFLAKTFNRYEYYCSNRVDMQEQNYIYYTGLNEDRQADDLTLLAVKKL